MKRLILLLLVLFWSVGCTEAATQEEILGEPTGTLGPAGGVLVSEDGKVRVEIPVGALDDETEIALVQAEAAPGGTLLPAYELLGEGVVFREPIRVVFSYEPGALGGTPALRIRVARAVAGTWDALEVPTVDTLLDQVSGLAWGLGPFAVISAGCSSTSDCADPKQCVRATCRHTPCETSAECMAEQVCDGGICLTLSPCDDTGACEPTHACVEGLCYPRGSCASVDDCADGEACQSGRCVLGQCAEDVDCSDGEICAAGICMLGQRCDGDGTCPGGSACVNMVCMRVDCTTSADCGSGYVCVELACVADQGCTTDVECGAGRICDDLSCSTPVSCLAGGTCEDVSKICDGSYCRTP